MTINNHDDVSAGKKSKCQRIQELFASFGADCQNWPKAEQKLLEETSNFTPQESETIHKYRQEAELTDCLCHKLFSTQAEPDFIHNASFPSLLLREVEETVTIGAAAFADHRQASRKTSLSEQFKEFAMMVGALLPSKTLKPRTMALAFSFTLIFGGISGGLDVVNGNIDNVKNETTATTSDDGWSLLLLGPETELLWKL